MENKNSTLICSICISLSLVFASVILSLGFGNIAKADRVVTVRGLAEKEVDADMAVWPLSFSLGGNNLQSLQKEIMDDITVVTQYLADHNLSEAEYTVQAPAITDTSVNPYMSDTGKRFTYIAKQVILVRSKNVNAVKSAQRDSLDLMGKNIAVLQDYDSKISYEFNGLNSIKTQRIADATENARSAAEQFAHDSGSKVGKIKSATQGLFSIEDAAVGLEEKKTVRVVTSVVYSLKD